MERSEWYQGNCRGRDLAASTIASMREDFAPHMLGQVVRKIIERGEYGAEEVGFFQRLGEQLL
ncbi:hypothetical protein I5E68_09640 [Novosphingobium sp. YJ-S2-02]|uniref:Uncharacterized protein n=1 Tax=Novosphingobium aureum TaxID=2792964 RepID=A0A931HCD0_9SPHN|nr:hypothetical protein [Novosphingobium aureum]MBH0113207.1 hypothetical protein [Novosphingobium aureum]